MPPPPVPQSKPSNRLLFVDMTASIDKLQNQLNGLRSSWNKAKKTFEWIENVRGKINKIPGVSVLSAISDTISDIDCKLVFRLMIS